MQALGFSRENSGPPEGLVVSIVDVMTVYSCLDSCIQLGIHYIITLAAYGHLWALITAGIQL